MCDGYLCLIRISRHRIKLLPNLHHTHSTLYPAGPIVREFQRLEINEILFQKVINPAQSEWTTPVIIAPVMDRFVCFCVEYRKLNNLARRDTHPILRMDERIYSLDKARVISLLDANSGHWEVKINDKDQD